MGLRHACLCQDRTGALGIRRPSSPKTDLLLYRPVYFILMLSSHREATIRCEHGTRLADQRNVFTRRIGRLSRFAAQDRLDNQVVLFPRLFEASLQPELSAAERRQPAARGS